MDISGTVALSRMMALQQKMDIVGNNIANMNTTGYKAVELLLKTDKVAPTAAGIRPMDSRPITMSSDWGTVRDNTPGGVKDTGNPLDVAIQGPGYFTVTNANGDDRYTRNGVFQVNSTGQLVDVSGDVVQGDGGNITIPAGTTSVSISGDGTVSSPKGILGKLKLVDFDNPQALQPSGNDTFEAADGAAPAPVQNPTVVQGAIEESNVNSVKEMTDMIEIERQYQSAANMVQSVHDQELSAIKDIAKIS